MSEPCLLNLKSLWDYNSKKYVKSYRIIVIPPTYTDVGLFTIKKTKLPST